MHSFSEIVLASASPRRSHLLATMGVRFRVYPAEVEEIHAMDCPRALVRKNARLKAEWVARRKPAALVLGSDTTVALDNKILNKPKDMQAATTMLEYLSGRTHTVYTAVCLAVQATGLLEQQVVHSEVTFRPLTAKTIQAYFSIVNPLDKAGAYGIQEGKELIIQSLQGSLNNVMGLPTEYLEALFIEKGWWERLRD